MSPIEHSTTVAPGQAQFEARFSPSPELVVLVRTFVRAFCERVVPDARLASRIALATHELLENSVKYSIDGVTDFAIEVSGSAAQASFEIRTRNRTPAPRAAELARRIDEMSRFADPFAYYQEIMRRCSRSPTPGGLGLGRIAAEAGMTIRCEIVEDQVTVIARSTHAQGAAA